MPGTSPCIAAPARVRMSSHSRMKGSLKVGWLLPTLALFAPQGALAQVHASLVSADSSIQAGHSATLALRLAHEPHWHTFWRNPGIGYATQIAWHLPPGWNLSLIHISEPTRQAE